eukprot:618554-Prymnesium_polylepis.1
MQAAHTRQPVPWTTRARCQPDVDRTVPVALRVDCSLPGGSSFCWRAEEPSCGRCRALLRLYFLLCHSTRDRTQEG